MPVMLPMSVPREMFVVRGLAAVVVRVVLAAGSPRAAITRDLLDWTPVRAGLIADLDQGHYFQP